mgnify:CR=1 FL=1
MRKESPSMYVGKHTGEQKTQPRIVNAIDRPDPSMEKHYET